MLGSYLSDELWDDLLSPCTSCVRVYFDPFEEIVYVAHHTDDYVLSTWDLGIVHVR